MNRNKSRNKETGKDAILVVQGKDMRHEFTWARMCSKIDGEKSADPCPVQ